VKFISKVAIVLLFFSSTSSVADQQTTAFAYTGFLRQNGTPVTGSRDMSFQLFDAAVNGTPVGSRIDIGDVPIANGVFIADLDFPEAFSGEQRWIEATVAGQVLSPRKAVTATPVAQFALSGNEGPQGPVGPTGPQGPPGPAGSLNCTTVVSRYPTGTFELQCPAGYSAVAASCDMGLSLVIGDSTRPLPPGSTRWIWYLIPSASSATGVHCELPNPSSTTEASVRCCQLSQ
jgi:hypothetical protein